MAISATAIIKPSVLRAFLQTEDSSTLANGRSVGDAWHQFLVNQTATDDKLMALERTWLRTEGATGEKLSELWSSYLGIKGFGTGNLADRMRAYFNSSAILVTFRLLQESGSGILTEDGAGALLLE